MDPPARLSVLGNIRSLGLYAWKLWYRVVHAQLPVIHDVTTSKEGWRDMRYGAISCNQTTLLYFIGSQKWFLYTIGMVSSLVCLVICFVEFNIFHVNLINVNKYEIILN